MLNYDYKHHYTLGENRLIYFDDPKTKPEAEKIYDVEISSDMTPEDVKKAQENFMDAREKLLRQIDENIKRNADPAKQREWKSIRAQFENAWKATAKETVGKRQDRILAAYKKLQSFDEVADRREFEELYGKPKNPEEFDRMFKEFEDEFTAGEKPVRARLHQLNREIDVIRKLAQEIGVSDEVKGRIDKLNNEIAMNIIFAARTYRAMWNLCKEQGWTDEKAEAFLSRSRGSKYRKPKER